MGVKQPHRENSRARSTKGREESGVVEVAIPKRILTIDIGGSKIKILVTGQTKPRRIPSHKKLSPSEMVQAVLKLARGWTFDAVSIGYPGLVGNHGPRSEPGNLGTGWVGFNFAAAFALPVKIVNDAAMQALGSYEGGRMLFLGLGTGLGSTLIAENIIIPLELGRLKYHRKDSFADVLGKRGLQRLGKRTWRHTVIEIATMLAEAFVADTVVLGGGNAKGLGVLPHGMQISGNQAAFRGGFRLWRLEDIRTHSTKSDHHLTDPTGGEAEWRML